MKFVSRDPLLKAIFDKRVKDVNYVFDELGKLTRPFGEFSIKLKSDKNTKE